MRPAIPPTPRRTGRPGRGGRWLRPGCAALVLVLSVACRTPDPQQRLVGEWTKGPAGWLLLPEDRETLESLRPGEWPLFLERFWARRSRLAPLFAARVAAADQLYGEPGRRGSLSDRGGALILLGEPRHLRVGEVTVPSPRARDGRRRSARLPSETWIYDPADLDPALRTLLEGERGASGPIELVFLSESDETRLVYGGDLLALAARAWVDSGDGGPGSPPARHESGSDSLSPPTESRRDAR